MPSDFTDPYIDSHTGILRNLVGATTYAELRNAEGELVSSRIGVALNRLSEKVTGALEDFCTIHKLLFQDVYDWAGEVRSVEIRKAGGDSEFFLPSNSIANGVI